MLTALDLTLVAIAACLVWWGSTGAILSLIALPEHTYRWSMLAVLLLAVIALGAVVMTRDAMTIATAMVAFAAAIVVWGAVEMTFLMGYVVGPNRDPSPLGDGALNRFKAAWWALAYHELALAGCLGILAAMVYGAPNPLAFHMFALLWAMRLSTKLNIFLGVSNASEDFLPARIAHLRSHFRKAPMNALFPCSVTAATAATLLFVAAALRPDATEFQAVSAMLLATFAGLALIEHWMLVLPLPTTALWPWAKRQAVVPDETRTAMAPAMAADL